MLRIRLVLLVSILLMSVSTFVSASGASYYPYLIETRVYSGSQLDVFAATVTISVAGLPPYQAVRIEKEGREYTTHDQPSWPVSETFAVNADAYGYLYFVDNAVMNSQYTYSFITSEGVRLTVPIVTYAELFVPAPYYAECGPLTLSSRLQIGSVGISNVYQVGYTRGTPDRIYSDETQIELWPNTEFVVVNGPVCDGQGSVWWQVVTRYAQMEYDQIMYVREWSGSQYWLTPTGTLETVATNRLLAGDRAYWTPVHDRFRINLREQPSWCQDEYGNYRARVVTQARFGEVYPVIAMTSDTRWVKLQLPNGGTGWASTHLGNVNFAVPFLSYGNIAGIFVPRPPIVDPFPPRSCDW